jgi:hypothetical protein
MKCTKDRWLRTSHMSVLGVCWKQAKEKRNVILGNKECTRKVTTGRKSSTHTCMEDLMKLGLGFLQCIVTAGEPEKYKGRYLGLIERGKGVDRGETYAKKKI